MGVALIAALTITAASFVGAPEVGVPSPDDVCKMLKTKQVVTIMADKPFGEPRPDEHGCTWETDPVERVEQGKYRYVFLEVKSLEQATDGYPDYRTALESGTREIRPVNGVGDEAYAGKTVLIPDGTIDSVNVVNGDTVVELNWQAARPVKRGSARYRQIIKIVRGTLAEV
jgi:hypothetical protein